MNAVLRLLLTLVLFGSNAGAAFGQADSIQTLETLPDAVPTGEAPADPGPVPAAPCGNQPMSLARMQWPTAAILAEIHSRLLSAHFGCEVRIQEGDLAATGSSMGASGQPAVAPEMWIARIADIWNAALGGQKVRQAGTSYVETVFEGWFVPAYTVTTWPDITTIEGLKLHAPEFGTAGQKPRFISCPVDWACSVINRNLLRAHGLDQLFEVVEPANRFEMDTLIAEAVGRQQPILFYYWQPNAILAQFSFNPVDLGAYDRDAFLCMGRTNCTSPLPTGFAPDPVVIAVSEWVYLDAPQVAAYFQRAKMPVGEMNAMLQQLSQGGATVEMVAERFVAERQDVWRPWVGQSAAEVLPDAGGEAPASAGTTNPVAPEQPETLPPPEAVVIAPSEPVEIAPPAPPAFPSLAN